MAKLGDATKANIPGVGTVNFLSPIALFKVFAGIVVLLFMYPFAQKTSGFLANLVPHKAAAPVSSDSPGYSILGQ